MDRKTQIIKCPKCGAGYRVPDEKLKSVETQIRCLKCKHSFVFVKDYYDNMQEEPVFAEGCTDVIESKTNDKIEACFRCGYNGHDKIPSSYAMAVISSNKECPNCGINYVTFFERLEHKRTCPRCQYCNDSIERECGKCGYQFMQNTTTAQHQQIYISPSANPTYGTHDVECNRHNDSAKSQHEPCKNESAVGAIIFISIIIAIVGLCAVAKVSGGQLIGMVIVIGILIGAAIGVKDMIIGDSPVKRAAREAQHNPVVRESLYGGSNYQMICPHCQYKGKVRTKSIDVKTGISGGKVLAGMATGGWSLLATGLSREDAKTQAHCDNCGADWLF